MTFNPPRALEVAAVLPPGDSIVGVYPHSIFRFDRIDLPDDASFAIANGGLHVSCDGQTLEALGKFGSGRTLCLGSFFALHIINRTSEPRPFKATVHGPAPSWPDDEPVSSAIVLGAFVQETGEPPAPTTDYGEASGGLVLGAHDPDLSDGFSIDDAHAEPVGGLVPGGQHPEMPDDFVIKEPESAPGDES